MQAVGNYRVLHTMIQKKVCMLGAFAVGKTSLVRRYVDSMFSDTYTTTIGVKVDKKTLTINETEMSLLLWDVYGEDSHQTVLPAYLRGMSGYILVTDPTRPNTYKSAVSLHKLVSDTLGAKPFIFVTNKADIKDQWNPEPADLVNQLQEIKSSAVRIVETSAKEDFGVDEMFRALATALLPPKKLDLPATIEAYLQDVSGTIAKTTVLKIDKNNHITDHGGDLARCGMFTIAEGQLIEQQIPLLAGLLPHTDEPLIIRNTQTDTGLFVDIHVLTDQSYQWVLFIDNTQLGNRLQAEQQVRLSNDIINESSNDRSNAD